MVGTRRGSKILAGVVVALAMAGDAAAAPLGSTQLISRPTGDAPVPNVSTGRSGLEDSTNDFAISAGHQVSQDGTRIAFISEADGLSGEDDDAVANVFVRDTVTNETFLVSRATGAGGAPAEAESTRPAISDDGLRVAFGTPATLDPVSDTNGTWDVYVRDLASNTTVLVSGHASMVGAFAPAIDADGSHVAFHTLHAIDAADTNGTWDVYLRAVDTADPPVLVSCLDGAGTASGNEGSLYPSLSDDATKVAFGTYASDFDPDDANATSDVAVRDLVTNMTTIVSRPTGGVPGNGLSDQAAISGNGNRVAFRSRASDLIGSDTNGDPDIFVRGLAAGATARVSLADDETQVDHSEGGMDPSLSDNGTLATFSTFDDIGDGLANVAKAYVRDLAAGTTTPVSRPTGTTGVSHGADGNLSGDGLSVAFLSNADDLSVDDDDSSDRHVYVRRLPLHAAPNTTHFLDRPTGTMPFTGSNGVDDSSIGPDNVSWGGRYVVFTSHADDLTPTQDNNVLNAFVRDTLTGITTQVNIREDATPDVEGVFEATAISADGTRVAFIGGQELTANGDLNTLYLRDLVANTTTAVSLADDGRAVRVGTDSISLSRDGQRVAFASSDADVSDADVDTDFEYDVFVRDVAGGPPTLASVSETGTESDDDSTRPSLNWDGSRVAFESTATNLVAGDVNGEADIFVRDLTAQTTVAASRATGAGGALGDGESLFPSLDGDGNRVAFASKATDFANGDDDAIEDIHVRDLAAGTTIWTTARRGASASLSEDGRRVAFRTDIAIDPDDDNGAGTEDIYLRDLDALTTTLVSRADGLDGDVGRLASGGSFGSIDDGPAISPDGTCVAFPSLAGNLAAAWTGSGIQHVYLRATGGDCPDVTGPDTTMDSGPSGTIDDTTPEFAFSTDERRARLECSTDGAAFAPCSSPVTLPALAEGAHTFRARAVDVIGNPDPTPAERTFTVDLPDPPAPPPPPAPPAADPPPAPPASPVAPASIAPVPQLPAKLKVLRAGIDDGVLDMLVEITSLAATSGAVLALDYHSSGRHTKFSVPVASASAAARGPLARAAEAQVKIRKKLPSTQSKDTGIVTLTYAGNAAVAADEVRLRAADGKALLKRGSTRLTAGRLHVDGTISDDARGVVRVRLGYPRADGSTGTLSWNARISDGAWGIDQALPAEAAAGGYVSIQFTGYEAAGMRGEQTGKAVP